MSGGGGRPEAEAVFVPGGVPHGAGEQLAGDQGRVGGVVALRVGHQRGCCCSLRNSHRLFFLFNSPFSFLSPWGIMYNFEPWHNKTAFSKPNLG